ncbi:hypothetical protein C7N43_35970 [Sphingobacteriales bacterium UPWRP_1]|nr:hypothetical protein B6N25_00755 [Sphingobacteriales bacterium TSM_CSS]PSJ72093.1 hypothetical protein C7N43_35970 [Sphingobacteriales bacterium UPWRP_1]
MIVPVSVSSADFDVIFESCSFYFVSLSRDSNSLSYELIKRFDNHITRQRPTVWENNQIILALILTVVDEMRTILKKINCFVAIA